MPPFRLKLVQKLIAGYASLVIFTAAALLFSVLGLYSLNKTAREIARKDLIVINNASKLRESLLAQERYAGKYAILKSDEFNELFEGRREEFLTTLQKVGQIRHDHDYDHLLDSYREYLKVRSLTFSGGTADSSHLKKTLDTVLAAIDTISRNQQQQLNDKIASADQKENETIRLTVILVVTGFILALGVSTLVIFNISSAIRKLKRATHRIAEGEFDYDPHIPAGDEIGELAEDFTRMAKKLKELEQVSLDASPLTRLPGNIAIESVLNQRLQEGELFAVCYGDLDNFKAYNDRYGYIKGSEVIKLTGEIIYEATRKLGDSTAFVGHVGGDDFVMVVAADRAAAVCELVIKEYDKAIKEHYSAEDIAKGVIEGVDRYGVARSFPIMSISIAVVICQRGLFDSAVEIAQTAAEIKDHIKGRTGSKYLFNRRALKR